MPNLASHFFAQRAGLPPAEIVVVNDMFELRIHNPYDPDVLAVTIGCLAAMEAAQAGLDDVTDDILDRAEVTARELIADALRVLDGGAQRTRTLVDFTNGTAEVGTTEVSDASQF